MRLLAKSQQGGMPLPAAKGGDPSQLHFSELLGVMYPPQSGASKLSSVRSYSTFVWTHSTYGSDSRYCSLFAQYSVQILVYYINTLGFWTLPKCPASRC